MSADSAERQRAFRESLGVSMPLIADTDKAITTLYDAREFIGFIPARLTYVIDTAGIIRSVGTHRVHMDRHSSEALTVVQELAAAQPPDQHP